MVGGGGWGRGEERGRGERRNVRKGVGIGLCGGGRGEVGRGEAC